jgi:hypothetical protein
VPEGNAQLVQGFFQRLLVVQGHFWDSEGTGSDAD